MIRDKLRKIVSIIFFIIIILIIIYYVKIHWQEFLQIRVVSWWSLLVLIILTPIFFLATALFFQKSIEPYNLKLSFNEYFGLTMITLMGNYLIPFSGLGVRAVYMKKKYAFPYHHFLTTVIVGWITSLLIFTLAGIITLLFNYFMIHQIDKGLMIVFLMIFLICVLSFFPLNINIKNKILFRIMAPLVLWQEYIRNKRILGELFWLTFWQFLITALIFYFAYLTFGFKITFMDSFLPTALTLYSSLIRLVPASLGFYEIAVIYPSRILGFSAAEGFSVAFLTRIVSFFWIFALGLIFSYILIKPKDKRKIFK